MPCDQVRRSVSVARRARRWPRRVLLGRGCAARPGANRHVPAQVSIDNFTFNPHSITVKAGTTVTWTNKDDIPHADRGDRQRVQIEALDTDDSYSFTFTTPGTYQYFCSLHPHMTGTIVVEAATGSNASA